MIWTHFLPALFMLWQLIAIQMGISHYFHFDKSESQSINYVMISISVGLLTVWFFIKTLYFMFYSISYRVEHELNKWVKVANMIIIFPYSMILSYALFNHHDPKQYELGYLTIFIISTLLVLNVVLTLNPIYKDQGTDSYSRSCCSSQNLMMTISFLFCFKVMEIHHFLVATEHQK